MKIIQVQTQAEAAGAQRVSDMVGEGLRQRGHDVRTVFMYRKTDAYDADPHADFILRTTPKGLAGQLHAASGLVGYLRREKPEAVLSYQHYGNVFGTIGGRLAGARILVANQSGVPLGGGFRGLATGLDRILGSLGVYHHSVVNSAWTLEQFAGYSAGYRKRLRRIDHGVRGPDRRYDQDAARAAFDLPQNVSLIVSSGRLNALKNHASLVAAVRDLPDVHLAIAGEGPERAALLAQAQQLGLGSRVHLVGEVPPGDIFRFLAAGDVFAFASLQETFGLAAVEAAIGGLPVVASDLPVMREVLTTRNGEKAALFVPPTDGGAVADALGRVLGDKDLAACLSGAGRLLAEKYAVSEMVEAYERLLV